MRAAIEKYERDGTILRYRAVVNPAGVDRTGSDVTALRNSAGQIVGYSNTLSGQNHAFLWDAVNGLQDLGTLGGLTSYAYGINDAGQIVGKASNNHAYRLTPISLNPAIMLLL